MPIMDKGAIRESMHVTIAKPLAALPLSPSGVKFFANSSFAWVKSEKSPLIALILPSHPKSGLPGGNMGISGEKRWPSTVFLDLGGY
jgi:hypothetical protein